MSKNLFHEYREEEIRTLISVPYQMFKELKESEEVHFIKHYNPSNRDKFKKDKSWEKVDKEIKELKKKQRDIESEIRVNG